MALRQVMAVSSTDEFSLGDLEKCTQEEMTALSVALKANAAEKRRQSGVRGVAGFVDKITATLPPYDMDSDYGLKKRVVPTIMGLIGAAISNTRSEKDTRALEAFVAVVDKNVSACPAEVFVFALIFCFSIHVAFMFSALRASSGLWPRALRTARRRRVPDLRGR